MKHVENNLGKKLLFSAFAPKRASLVPTLTGLAPGGAGGLPEAPAALTLALATSVRVVDRVHRHATDVRADAAPPVLAGLVELGDGEVGGGGGDQRSAAGQEELAVAGGELNEDSLGSGLLDDLGIRAAGADQLAALPRPHLYVVDKGADSHLLDEHASPNLGSWVDPGCYVAVSVHGVR